MTRGIVRALGWLVIAHGLAHAVLPLRGLTASAVDVTPMVLYTMSIVGFVAAGLGLLGLRPFTSAISPTLVLSSGLSIVAIQQLHEPDLWLGGAFDCAFFFLGVWRGYAGWPVVGPQHGRVWHVLGLTAGFVFLTYVAGSTIAWQWHRTWGATSAELAMSLPGDKTFRDPAFEIQHGVTIDVGPEQVWPWLMQLGQDRAGFYSYDWLERAFGVDVHNRFELRSEWQERQVGDLVPATQPAYLGGLFGENPGWKITELRPERAMVLANWGAFVLVPTTQGRTRFIIRTTTSGPSIPAWAAVLDFLGFQLPHFIMERRMMLTIKALAEQHRNTMAASYMPSATE